MRREYRERFPRHPLQRKPLVSDPGMHHGTCGTHVLWCMSESLTRSGGENVPGIPGACATHNFTYLARGPCCLKFILQRNIAHFYNIHFSTHRHALSQHMWLPIFWAIFYVANPCWAALLLHHHRNLCFKCGRYSKGVYSPNTLRHISSHLK